MAHRSKKQLPHAPSAAEETWRVFRIMAEFVEGFEVMSRVGPAIAVFGSARTPPGDRYYEQAVTVGRRLVEEGFAVITGGGPGIMEAANKGAFEAGGTSVGLNISLPMEQKANAYQNVSLEFDHFFARKVMFVKYAQGLICMPGGFGTMDEFYESMTLIQTGKSAQYPLVLIGSEFWGPMVDWLRGTMLTQFGNISAEDMELFRLIDDVDDAVAFVVERYRADLQELQRQAEALPAAHVPWGGMTAEGTRIGRPRRSQPAPGW
jgi:uncharacterized protein (TIGR00730 family)